MGLNRRTAAVGLVAAVVLSGCSSGTSASTASTCDQVQKTWIAYFTAVKELNAAGASPTARQKADFRAVRIGTLADLTRIAAAGDEKVNKGAGLIATSLTTADQATAEQAMTDATVTLKKACGYTLGL